VFAGPAVEFEIAKVALAASGRVALCLPRTVRIITPCAKQHGDSIVRAEREFICKTPGQEDRAEGLKGASELAATHSERDGSVRNFNAHSHRDRKIIDVCGSAGENDPILAAA